VNTGPVGAPADPILMAKMAEVSTIKCLFTLYYILEILWAISEFIWGLVVGVISLILYCGLGGFDCAQIGTGATILMVEGILKLIF